MTEVVRSNKPEKELSELELSTLENIGRNVRFTRRKLLEVTLVTMAEFTGVSRDVLCRLESMAHMDEGRDTSYPSISTMIKFCESVGVTPAELLSKDFKTDLEIQQRIQDSCANILRKVEPVDSKI